MSYAGMTLPQMAAAVDQEMGHIHRLDRAGRMWREARDELSLSVAALRTEIATLAPQWTDQAGGLFTARASEAERGMAAWVARIDAARPWVALDALVAEIPATRTFVHQLLAAARALAATAQEPIQRQVRVLQAQAAERMTALGALYTEAARAVGAAAQGEQAATTGGGGPEAGGPGGPAGGPAGGSAGGPAGGGPAAAGGGAPGGAAGGAGGPALSGGAASPGAVAPPKLPSAVPPSVDLPRPTTPAPHLPVAPPVRVPGAVGVSPVSSARGVGGVRGIGGSALTGVSGVPAIARVSKPATITAAATPPQPPSSPTPAGTASPPTTGNGAMPPMMPPASAASPSGSGRPKPGNAQRQPDGKGRRRTGTPGVPDHLRGRANPGGEPPARSERRPVPDAESLDEDLWQTGKPKSPLTGR